MSNVCYNNYLTRLRIFFNWSIKQGYIEKNPVDKIQKRKTNAEDIRYYTVEECKEWLDKALGNTKLYVALALFTGIRKAELVRLRYENIFLDDKEIVLSAGITKTLQRRVVKLPDNLIKYLQEADVSNKTGLIFRSENAVTCAIKRLTMKVSFTPIKNGFRHTSASYYLAMTQNEYETARQLGHSVDILKRHYAGLARQKEAEAFYKL